jgi:predicted kinase
MVMLYICRGLPGSGKSTAARVWVSEDPKNRAEVNRDHIRMMLHGGFADQEKEVTDISHGNIKALLGMGKSVVCSDTNLPQKTVRDLARIGWAAGAEVLVWDMTDVPLMTCVERNAARKDKDPVPNEAIVRMHDRYIRGKKYPLPLPEKDKGTVADLYVPTLGKPRLLIVDIDGTVAKIPEGGRSPYDYTRVSEDVPNQPVIDVVMAMVCDGWILGHMSGREGTDQCRRDTESWLRWHVRITPAFLEMRPEGNKENDAIVKRRMFDERVRGNYGEVIVLDDRDRVVRMWREELGLTVLQVAPGFF